MQSNPPNSNPKFTTSMQAYVLQVNHRTYLCVVVGYQCDPNRTPKKKLMHCQTQKKKTRNHFGRRYSLTDRR